MVNFQYSTRFHVDPFCIIEKCCGIELKIKKEDVIFVIDIEGQQVADLFAVNKHDQNEFFSTAVTIDTNMKIEIKASVFKPGDCVVFRAEMDLVICIPACNLIEGICNAGIVKLLKFYQGLRNLNAEIQAS